MPSKNENNSIKVVELFAGVGGFRIGLEGYEGRSATSDYQKRFDSPYRVIWSNQWEPSTKVQHASDVYVARFTDKGHVNEDIMEYPVARIPDHDLLVGGFPCQDYSVARTLNQAEGLVGKKGVLWWAIHRILAEKKRKPKVLFLENVDRLLKSPAQQRGRDFAVMLASLSDLGYALEWRVINAAEYGMPQRRRRIFILAYRRNSQIGKELFKITDPMAWIIRDGIFAQAFPVSNPQNFLATSFSIQGDLDVISERFPMNVYDDGPNLKSADHSPFENSGIMIDRCVHTIRTEPDFRGKIKTLGDIIYRNGDFQIDPSYFLEPYSLDTWTYLKGAKKDNPRKSKSGFVYHYNEGPMAFPDPTERPSRTIITGEGGSTPSRFKHVVDVGNKERNEVKLRRLIPEELERLNMFPPGHTKLDGISDVKRAFFMGNALVVGIVEIVGRTLAERWRLGE
ncbi:MAG: DNA (cytosine-5-)-methyltransferase [Chloracidobacterium sp.]|nr:DNA (cytosine-5-)-methyltransferase [Chloracidobacterium sp.]